MRPVAPPGKTAGTQGVRSGQTPFESQDFESLLASAREDLPGLDGLQDESAEATDTKRPPGPLDPLADFGRIENPGLREMLAQQRPNLQPSNTETRQQAAA